MVLLQGDCRQEGCWMGGKGSQASVGVPARGSHARSLAGSLSCCTFLQLLKGLQREQDQTHPVELAWALGEKVSHTFCPNSTSREVCGCPGAVTDPTEPLSPVPVPSAHPFPAVPSGLCDALQTGGGSTASCLPRCPQHKVLLRRRITLGFKGESRTKNRTL